MPKCNGSESQHLLFLHHCGAFGTYSWKFIIFYQFIALILNLGLRIKCALSKLPWNLSKLVAGVWKFIVLVHLFTFLALCCCFSGIIIIISMRAELKIIRTEINTFALLWMWDYVLCDIFCPSARSSPPWRWGLQTTSPQKSSRRWRMGRASMGLSATGGPWASACMKCCMARLLSMQSPWWKRMGRSWTTRWAYRVWSWFWYVYLWDFYTLSSFNWNSYKKSAVTEFQTEVKKNDYIRLKHCVLNLISVFEIDHLKSQHALNAAT